MATLRLDATLVPVPPMPIADQQVAILRAVTHTAPTDEPMVLGGGFELVPWEHRFLHTEAAGNRDVRGEALTLLRARATEWSMVELLRTPGRFTVEAASRRLDETLAEIGVTTEFPECRNRLGLERIAHRLNALYDEIAELSLHLGGTAPRAPAKGPWLLAKVSDAEFPIGELRGRKDRGVADEPTPEFGPDPFELERLGPPDVAVSDLAPPQTAWAASELAPQQPEPVRVPPPRQAQNSASSELVPQQSEPARLPPPLADVNAESVKPVAPQAAPAKAAPAKPVAVKPVAVKPVAVKPVAVKPVAAKPVAVKPGMSVSHKPLQASESPNSSLPYAAVAAIVIIGAIIAFVVL